MHDDQNMGVHAVTLLGGGPVDPDDLALATAIAPRIIAADGGARHAAPLGLPLAEIVGDFDSLTNQDLWRKSGTKLTYLPEQDSTDFEKCLYQTVAPMYVGVGFLGRRLDHTLACLRTLAAYPDKHVILLGEQEIVFHCNNSIEVPVTEGERVSLFPMRKVAGIASGGLRWPIGGLQFAPDGQIGTSNIATGGAVSLEFDGPGMLILLDKSHLTTVAERLCEGITR